jgi:hypothetical protein
LRAANILRLAEDIPSMLAWRHQTLVSTIRQAVESFPMQPNGVWQAARTMAGLEKLRADPIR